MSAPATVHPAYAEWMKGAEDRQAAYAALDARSSRTGYTPARLTDADIDGFAPSFPTETVQEREHRLYDAELVDRQSGPVSL